MTTAVADNSLMKRPDLSFAPGARSTLSTPFLLEVDQPHNLRH
jgi:hypothetical protein